MGLLIIDEDKCKRDGLCIQECPIQVLEFTAEGSFPSSAASAEAFCLQCGHCIAVCPHSALQLKDMPLEECPPLQKELLPDAAQIKRFLTARRTIRRFKKKTVPHELLYELFDTARYAPTGSNKQQVHWMVFEDPAEVRRLAGLVMDWTIMMSANVPDEAFAVRINRMMTA